MTAQLKGTAEGGWSVMSLKALFIAILGGCVAAGTAQAANIQIQFEDLDINYSNATQIIGSGSTIGVASTDTLTVANFIVDGVPVGSDVTDVTIDLSIPGVQPILNNVNNIVGTNPGGTLVLNFGGGESVSLTLDEVTVIFQALSSTIEFVAGASVASIDSQSLPFGLTLEEPVVVSFSSQVATLSHAGAFVGTFTAAGTGEISSGSQIPEPTSLGLLALGGLMTSVMAYRYRLG
jgi:hypothetical protein